MAGNESGDLLMMVLPTKGNAVDAESSSKITPATDGIIKIPAPVNPLLKGFKEGKMFEISEFQFGVATLSDPKKGAGAGSTKLYSHLAASAATIGRAAADEAARLAKGLAPPNTPQGDAKSCPVEPITFNRPIDNASTVLMGYCINCTTLHGAVIIKRKPAGGPSSGETFLRLEFIDVLFIDMAWSNADIIEERCTFITRAVNVLYRPQLPDGSLGAVRSGFWSRKADSQGEQLVYPPS